MKPEKQDTTGVYLWVMDYGEDASVVTKLLGLEPTRICIPGQPGSPTSRVPSRHHGWEFNSPLPLTAHIDEHLEALLQVLEPHAEAIRAASEKFKVGINSYVYYYVDWQPGIHLTERSVRLLADMNLSVDFDLYYLGDTSSR